MWQWRVTGLWQTSISPQDKRRMYLLSKPRGGRWPATSRGLETLEIMCNLIFTQNKSERMDREAAPQKKQEEWAVVLDRHIPKGSWTFSSQATHSRHAAADSIHTSDTCLNGILAWDCRCWKGIVQKQLCCSYSPFFTLSYFTSVSFTGSSILSSSFSTHRPHTHSSSIFYPFVQSLLVSVSTWKLLCLLGWCHHKWN